MRKALPYMGNIHIEVCPVSVMSRRRKDKRAVYMISIHHPIRPHLINSSVALFNEISAFTSQPIVFATHANVNRFKRCFFIFIV